MALSSNPKAACLRLTTCSPSKARRQRRHDMRSGRLPDYVDASRSHLNRCLVSPRPFAQITDEIDGLRAAAGRKRKRKKNAAILIAGIVGFGTQAQDHFGALTDSQQDAAILALVKAVALRLETVVESIDIHRDESAFHAHFSLRAYDEGGEPLSARMNAELLGDLQTLTFQVLSEFCSEIERGHKKQDRLDSGAPMADVIHRSVHRLHIDLPLEISRREAQKEDIIAACEIARDELTAIKANRSHEIEQAQAIRQAADEAKKQAEAVQRKAKLEYDEAKAIADDMHLVVTALAENRICFGAAGDWLIETQSNQPIHPRVRDAMKPRITRLLMLERDISAREQETRELKAQMEDWLAHPDLADELRRSGKDLLCTEEAVAQLNP